MLFICWPLLGPTTAWALVSHLLFLFNFDPQLGHSVVPAGWAVGVEMLFYAVLPLAMVWITTLRRAVLLTVVSAAASILWRWVFAPPTWSPDWSAMHVALFTLPPNLLFFAAGILSHHLVVSRCLQPVQVAVISRASLIALFLIAMGTPFTDGIGWPESLLWVLPFMGLCMSQAIRPSAWLASAPMQWLGERSFSIYLLHDFIVYILIGTGVYGAVNDALEGLLGPWTLLVRVVLTIIVVLPIAALTHTVVELPGQEAGRWLIQRLRQRASA